MDAMMFYGILISLVFTELTGLSPGGVIVPAYFALYFDDPLRMLWTLCAAAGCMGLVRLLSRYTILYGRRRFAAYLLAGIALKALFGFLYAESLTPLPGLAQSIGYVIPGLLGREAERQGVVATAVSLGIVVCLLRLAQILLIGA